MLAGVWVLYFCFGLTTTALAPLVPVIAAELQLSHAAMGGVLGAWPLVYIASAVPCGVLLDRLGLRWSLGLAAAVMGLSGLLRALAADHVELFLAVAVFGLGGPLVSVGVPKLIDLWFTGQGRALAMGFCVAAPALGGVVALSLTNSVALPLAGGSWRAVLVAYAVVVLTAGGAWLAVSAHPRSRTVDRRALAEPRRSQLLVFADLLRARSVQVVLVMSIGIFFFNHGLNNWLPEILRTGGMDAAAAGYWASVPTAVGLVGALVIPRLAMPGRRLAILCALFACGGLAMFLIRSPAGAVLMTGLFLQGIARGSMTALAMLVLMDMRDVGSRNVGAAGGLFFAAAEIGGVLGPLTIGALYDWTGGFAAALYLMMAVCAALMMLLRPLGRLDIRGYGVEPSGRRHTSMT
ncbi:MAG: MFS transporter [Candidatus Rokubacteria bacterium]|nr:MFS transporter [Candidatus Rokubacteria bacterium]